jgi:hypothetical protein
VKLLERLELQPPQYRLSLSEDDLKVLGTAVWLYIKHQEPSDLTALMAQELAGILRKVSGDDSRWFIRMAKKLEQKVKRKPILRKKK